MSNSFTVNGNTYTWPDQFEAYNYVGIWPSMINDCVAQFATDISDAQAQATDAATSAAAAAASAATATTSAATQATSVTSLTIALGTQTMTVQTGKGFANGMQARIAKNDGSQNFMDGVVTSYNSGTGTLVVNVIQTTGSGTLTAWNVFMEGPLPSVNLGGNATVSSGAASIVLTSSSPRSQNVTFTAQGLSVTLPDATTLTLGGPLFSISNAGLYAFAVRRKDASILTVVPPGGCADVYLDANGTAAGTWHANGQNLLAGLIYSPANSLANSTTQMANAFWQCGTTVILLGAGGSSGVLYAQAFDMSQTPCAIGAAVLVSSSFNSNNYTSQLAAVTMDGTHLLVAFQNSSTVAITGIVLTLSGSTISVGSPSTLATVTAAGTISSIVLLSATLAVMLYTNGTNCYTVAMALSAGTVSSAGTPVAITSANANIASAQTYANVYPAGTAPLVALSATSFIVAAGNSSNAFVQAATISGTTITFGTVYSATNHDPVAGLLLLAASTVMLVGHVSANYQSFQVMTVSGSAITHGSAYTDATASTMPVAATAFSASLVGIVVNASYYAVIAVSGTTITSSVAATAAAAGGQQNLINQGSDILTWNSPAAGNSGFIDSMTYSVLTSSGATNTTLHLNMPPGLLASIVPTAAGNYLFSGNSHLYNGSGNISGDNIIHAYKFSGTTPQFVGAITGGQNDGPTKFWPLSATQILVNLANQTAQILEMAA